MIGAARKVRALKSKQEESTKKLRDLAKEARTIDKSLLHRIDSSVIMVNFPSAIDQLCEKLEGAKV